MGEGKNCIADSYGKIKDYKNLFVNDSSLINTNLLKNPQGTIMSIAYRNIDNFIKNND
jgi:choline dehydrogenase-like flavoprotein